MGYLSNLYGRTMREAYGYACGHVMEAAKAGGRLLECGAGDGARFARLAKEAGAPVDGYVGMEWNPDLADRGAGLGYDVRRGDLNLPLPFDDNTFDCVFALSVLEHLLNGCRYISEAKRILKPDGKLVLLTPNISTYFTAALILAGRMPSTGPHPDSDALLETAIDMHVNKVDRNNESDTPEHRHLVVFSYSALRRYLDLAGYVDINGRGFGLYPFPNFAQPLLERIDPWHCHQMIFIARKP